jgi:hypothetical protein
MRKLVWKKINDAWNGGQPDGHTYRAKVPGGWLVSVWAGDDKDHGLGGGLTFLPDPGNEWDVEEDAAAGTPS